MHESYQHPSNPSLRDREGQSREKYGNNTVHGSHFKAKTGYLAFVGDFSVETIK